MIENWSHRIFFSNKDLIENVLFLSIERTLTGITTPSQSGSGSNGNEGMIPHSPELEPHH